MYAFVFLIVVSFTFYIVYKVRSVRTNRPVEKRWLSAKSSIALGLFVGFFGINQLFLRQTTVTYIIAALFILIGFGSVWAGWKAYRHYLPYAISEAEELDKK
ncbi:YtpI family protein [Rossellomorea sp. BNER]|jgi:O-antigen/teichoic acid export membrane protein|uniref:YtpI family protein n=1 Tax=Rossellomorea sp. BNER TaxID=2962031 RepID=UPI003AF2407A|nr:YtpI family protein [Rossellomorea sp. BNER]